MAVFIASFLNPAALAAVILIETFKALSKIPTRELLLSGAVSAI